MGAKLSVKSSWPYLTGVLLGVIAVTAVAVGFVGLGERRPVRRPITEGGIAFDPDYYDVSQPWILPGTLRTFDAWLRNDSDTDAWVHELRFSCSCATGQIGGDATFPVRVPPQSVVPVRVNIKSTNGESGLAEVRFGVVGRAVCGPFDTGAVAAVRYVQRLNAEPRIVSLGRVSADAPLPDLVVDIWGPSNLGPLMVSSAEVTHPCLSVEIEPEGLVDGKDSGRLNLASLRVFVNRELAPPQLSEAVHVRAADGSVVVVPVLGVFELPRKIEP